jgi:hypothetical protein
MEIARAQVALAWLLAKDAVNVKLSSEELAQMDAATSPSAVYPNWFLDGLADQPSAQALATMRR